MPLILNKRDFFERAKVGLCWNVPRFWDDIEEFMALPVKPRYVGVRFKTAQVPNNTSFTIDEALEFCKNLRKGQFVIQESDGIQKEESVLGLQGELSKLNGNWYLYYALHLGHMRVRLKEEGRHAVGLTVLALLREFVEPRYCDKLLELFDYYTEGDITPVIEFSQLRRPIGYFFEKLAVWEVRHRK